MIIEHVTFRLAPGVDEATFLAADRRVQTEIAPFATGFVRRTTARGVDGRWLVETLWASADDATGAAEAVLGPLRPMLDEPSLHVARFETLD